MRHLITGGAGFIGSHMADALTRRGDSVLILDDLSTGRLESLEHLLGLDAVTFVEGSVLDAALLDECTRSVDTCFHLASTVGVKLVVDRPLDSLLNGFRGNDIVISAAARHRRRLVFASTSEIYGKTNSDALDEDSDRLIGSPFTARWGYAIAKSLGEALVHAYCRELGAPLTAVRPFNTVGARQLGRYGMVLPRFVCQALAGDDLTVYGDGRQTRCFTHVDDTVRALVLLSGFPAAIGNVYNVGSSTEVRILDLARRVIERTGSSSKVRYVPYEEAYEQGFEELGRRVPDTSALQGLTGWKPLRTLDDAIDDVIAYQSLALSADAHARSNGKVRRFVGGAGLPAGRATAPGMPSGGDV